MCWISLTFDPYQRGKPFHLDPTCQSIILEGARAAAATAGAFQDDWLAGRVKMKGFPTLLGVKGQIDPTHIWLYLVSFLRYSMSKNVVTLKSGSKVTHGHWEWYHSIDRVWFLLVFFSNFVPKMHRFCDIRLQKCRDLENRVRGPSRSLEMSPFDRAHMTSYWHSIVTMALSRVVSELFNV